MQSHFKKFWRVLAACAVLTTAAAPALAIPTTLSFMIQAQNGEGTAVPFQANLQPIPGSPGEWEWTMAPGNTIELRSSTNVLIGVLEGMDVFVKEDPQISLSYAVRAGAMDTTFTITSPHLTGLAISAATAEGRATAAITTTDINGNGSLLTGLEPGPSGPRAYLAQYNGIVPTGTTFSALIPSVSSAPGQSGSQAEFDPLPAGTYRPVGSDVFDMSSQFRFTLSARDTSSATSFYEIIPEPATLSLLGLGAVALLRRRSR